MKKNKSLPDLPEDQKERLTLYCHDQAKAEGVTPAAIAHRAANDPELLKKAIAYQRPVPPPEAAKPPPENRKPKTENHPPKPADAPNS